MIPMESRHITAALPMRLNSQIPKPPFSEGELTLLVLASSPMAFLDPKSFTVGILQEKPLGEGARTSQVTSSSLNSAPNGGWVMSMFNRLNDR